MSRQIIFIELTQGGHRRSILRYLVEYAREKNIEVKVATLEKTIKLGGFSSLGVPLLPIEVVRSKTAFIELFQANLQNQVDIYNSIKKFLLSTPPDTKIVFPTLQASGAIPLAFSIRGYCRPWIGLLMAPAPHLKSIDISTHHTKAELLIQSIAYRRLVANQNCKRLGCFDPYFVKWMDSERAVYCPDPVEVFSEHTSIGEDVTKLEGIRKPILLIVGTVDKRKKVMEVAKAVAALPDKPIHLVVAGSLKDDAKTEIESEIMQDLISSGHATTIFRWLTDMEKDFLIHISSIVWSGNIRAYGSSGAIVQAGMHRKPVISMAGSMMGNWLQDSGGGPSIDMTDQSALKKELALLLNKEYAARLGENNYRLFCENDKEYFAKQLLDPFIH